MISPESFVKHYIKKLNYRHTFPDYIKQKESSLQQLLDIVPRIIKDQSLPTHLYSPIYLEMIDLISKNPQTKKEIAEVPTLDGLKNKYCIYAWQYGHQPPIIEEKSDYKAMVHNMIRKHGSFTQIYITTLWNPLFKQNVCGSMGIFHCTPDSFRQEQGIVANFNNNTVDSKNDPFIFLPLVCNSISLNSSYQTSTLENPFRFQVKQSDGNWLTFYPVRISESEVSFFTRYIVDSSKKPKKKIPEKSTHRVLNFGQI